MSGDGFVRVGRRPEPSQPAIKKRRRRVPAAGVVLAVLAALCFGCRLVMTHAPGYLDLAHCSVPPCREFLFGTDTLGRDLFSMIWYGGRTSLLIGLEAAAVAGVLALTVGAAAGLGPRWLDAVLMRAAELLLSVPGLLLVLLLQGVLGTGRAWQLALVIGLTGWPAMAQVVRTETRRLRGCAFVEAARCMGGGFWQLLRRHIVPNVLPTVGFQLVMQVRGAILSEATLSFLGLGLPVESVSWGSMLSLADRAALSGDWWVLAVPGVFLIGTLYCLTALGGGLGETKS